MVAADHLFLLRSDAKVTRYNSGKGERAFCSRSPLWFEPEGLPQFRGIPLGVIDSGDVPSPEMQRQKFKGLRAEERRSGNLSTP
jgi:hypothetical protein